MIPRKSLRIWFFFCSKTDRKKRPFTKNRVERSAGSSNARLYVTITASCQPPVQWALQGPPETTQAFPLIDVGDLVYLQLRQKQVSGSRPIPCRVRWPPFCNIKKFVGSQLRSSSYRVKLSQCFRVPVTTSDPSASLRCHCENSADEDDLLPEPNPPPSPHDIPDAISVPAFQGSPPSQELPPALAGPPSDSRTDQAPHNVNVLQETAPWTSRG